MTPRERTVRRLQGRTEAITAASSTLALALAATALVHMIAQALPRLIPALFA